MLQPRSVSVSESLVKKKRGTNLYHELLVTFQSHTVT